MGTEFLAQHRRSPAASDDPATLRSTDALERARVSVTRAIRAALQRLGAYHPALVEHLSATVRTGAACSYAPDPRRRIEWDL